LRCLVDQKIELLWLIRSAPAGEPLTQLPYDERPSLQLALGCGLWDAWAQKLEEWKVLF